MQEPKTAYRQGDILLFCHATIPENARPLPHLTLAEGEATGHLHQISQGQATLLEVGEQFFLCVESETAVLTHPEHGRMALPKGDYEVIRQREYHPTMESMKKWHYVAD